jgi:hypothetical protein
MGYGVTSKGLDIFFTSFGFVPMILFIVWWTLKENMLWIG